jgi:predicted Zn-dependent peptidase
VESIAAFHAVRYIPGNVVLAAAGSVDHDRLVELISERIPRATGSAPEPEPAPEHPQPAVRMRVKDTEQYHVCLGAPGVARGDDRRFALRILDAIFGGTSSSRLFQEIREKRGLAYAVSSFSGQYADTGQVGLYLGTRPDNLAEALRVVAGELERIRSEPVSAAELERAQEHAKGRLVLSLESTSSRMNRLGSSVLTGVPLLSVDESIERIEAVDAEQVQALAAELLDSDRLSAAGVGPDESVFRGALEPLGAGLAAAA